MKTRYITLDMMSLSDIKKAERLLARGWLIIRPGLFYITMQSPNNQNHRSAK